MKWEEAPLVDSPKWAGAPLAEEPKWAKAPIAGGKQGSIVDAASRAAGLHGVLLGGIEAGAQVASGFGSQVAGGIRALASPITGEDPRKAIEETQEKLTYQPRTGYGKAISETVAPAFEYLEKGLTFAGEKTAEVTGSPAAGAAVKAGLSIAPIPFLKGRAKGRPEAPIEAKPERPIWEVPKSEIVDPVAHEIAVRIAAKDGKPIPQEVLNDYPDLKPKEIKPPEPPKTVGDFHEPIFKPEVAPQITKGISDLAKEFFAENPKERNPQLLISDDIVRQGLAGKVPEEMLSKHSLKPEEFQVLWRKTVTSAAQTLARLSQIERRLKLTPEEADVLRKNGLDVDDATIIQPLWKRLDNIRRGLLVTQFATAARNAVTQAGRLSLDVLQAPIDASIQSLAGKKPTASPFDGLDQFAQLFKKNKDAVDQILANQPRAREKMFATYMSDVAAADKSAKGKVLSGVEKAVDILNWANKGQELIIRRAVFQANLSQTMRRNGLDLERMIKNNEFDAIPQEHIESAVNKSLEVTFSETPKYGTARRAFIDLINKVPGATLAIPFPRFLMNAVKFLWDYNPTGFLNYLSKRERAAFAAGDTSKMSKAVIGSGLFATALYFRNSDYAGEKWYEAKTPDGKIIDLRPFNPFAAYIFLADIAKRSHEGTLHRLTAKDLAMGVLSTQLRAGTGLYVLDESLKSLASDANNEEKWKRRAKEFAGEIVGGTLMPLAQLRDLYAEFDEESRKLRDTRQEPFLGPIKRQIPGLSKTLPEAEIPTRAGPIEQIHPGVRQLTGISVTGPKNPIEKELDRLGFERYEILRSTGDPALDRKQAEVMGPLVEKIGGRIVKNPSYQKMTDAQKSVLLNEVVEKIRAAARGVAKSTLPAEEHLKQKIENQSPRTRRLLNEIGIQ